MSTSVNTCGSEASDISRGMLQPQWLLVSSVVKATDVCSAVSGEVVVPAV